jgi:NitT/TauT family transport system substrate-binding protein
LLVCVAIVSISANCQAEVLKLKTVTVLQPIPAPDIRFAPWAVAIERGWLAEEGLKIDMQTTNGSIIVAQQVLNGNAEYGLPAPEATVVARIKGAPLRYFYGITSRNPFPLAILRDGPVKSLSDLKGSDIGVFSLTAVQFYTTQAILQSVGFKLNRDYRLLGVGAGTAPLRALQDGTISALSLNALAYAEFENRGARLAYLTTPEIDPILAWGLIATDSYLAANRREAVGLARAFTKGRIFCAENPESCIKAYLGQFPTARTAGLSEKQAVEAQLRTLKVFFDYSPRPTNGLWGSYDRAAWAAIVKYMLESGQSERAIDPTLMYTNDLIAEINQFDANKIAADAATAGH